MGTCSGSQSVFIVVGKAWHEEPEAAGPIVSAVRRPGETNVVFSSLSPLLPRKVLPTIRCVFSLNAI